MDGSKSHEEIEEELRQRRRRLNELDDDVTELHTLMVGEPGQDGQPGVYEMLRNNKQRAKNNRKLLWVLATFNVTLIASIIGIITV